MFHNFAVFLTGHFLKQDIIEETQVPFCCYKLEQLIGSGIFAFILLLISIATESYLEIISFSISASVFRRHMGGWHAPSAWLCQIMSILLVLLAVFFVGPIIETLGNPAIVFSSAIALTLISLFISPAFPPQMHMSKTEIFANQRLKNIYLLILLLVQLISYLCLDYRISIYSALGLVITVFTVLLEKTKRCRKDDPHEKPERTH